VKTGQKVVGPLLLVVTLGSACGKSSSKDVGGIGGKGSAGTSAGAVAGTTQGTTGGAHAAGGVRNGGAPAGGAPTAGIPGTGGTDAGTSGAAPHGGTPSAGNAGSGGASAGTAAGMASGGAPAAGNAGIGAGGESAASGGTLGEAGAPAGGAGGARSELGFDCGSARCARGEVCVRCPLGSPIDGTHRCVPHPETDPSSYAEAVAECFAEPTAYEECDGPEDCASGEHCVAKAEPSGLSRCGSMPATGFETCCFACNALLNCTLCRTSADCPAQRNECEPVQMGPAGLLGCQ
jgi:hypothetical protein